MSSSRSPISYDPKVFTSNIILHSKQELQLQQNTKHRCDFSRPCVTKWNFQEAHNPPSWHSFQCLPYMTCKTGGSP